MTCMFGPTPYVLTTYKPNDSEPHKKTSQCDPATCIDLTREQCVEFFQRIFSFPLTEDAIDTIRLCLNLTAPSVKVYPTTSDEQVWVDSRYWWHIPYPHTTPTYDPIHEIGKMIGGLLNVVNSQLPSNTDNKLARTHLQSIERKLDELKQWRLRQR